MQVPNKSKLTIPNWTAFKSHLVAIQIYEIENEDEYDRVLYQSSLVFFIDDGSKLNIEDCRAIILMTDIVNYEIDDCILETVASIKYIFERVSNTSIVFNINKKIIKKIDINKLIQNVRYEEELFSSMDEARNKTIH